MEHVAEGSQYSLLGRANSWYVGANIPGKPRVVAPYAGGQSLYRERCEAVVNSGYEGLEFGGRNGVVEDGPGIRAVVPFCVVVLDPKMGLRLG